MTDDSLEKFDPSDDDVVSAWEFVATLELRTPLAVLEHDGETVGAHDPRPQYGPDWAGTWLPVLKSWDELGLGEFFVDPGTQPERASFIGGVPADGGEVLKFLKGYRRIVEQNERTQVREMHLREYLARPEHAEITCLLEGDPAADPGIEALQESLAIGRALAERLYRAGFVDVESVRAAPDSALLELEGIGAKRLAALRSAIGMGR